MRAPILSPAARHRSTTRRLRGDKRGVAAVEFALVATILMATTLGFFQMALAMRAKMLLSSAVANMAEMIAAEDGVPPVTQAVLRDYCKGVQLTMRSYTTTSLSMAVASVTYATGSNGPARDWEYDYACPTMAGALGATGAKSLASSMVPSSGDSVILIQASFTYIPVISSVLSPITLTATSFARPRYGTVTCPTC